VWVGVLVGAPSGLLVGIGVAKLATYILPVPPELVEQFGKELLPENVPFWQLVLILSVLPGICEEIAFRGLLLYGMRKRFGPVGLCLFVGCVFGLFHFALFRLVPTALLGVILSSVVVMTGSIFPAMLWHALNNGISVVAALGFGVEVGTAWWHSAVAVVPLVFSLWLIRRYGRGYPDLRS
jgi:sodium transport system permease protein